MGQSPRYHNQRRPVLHVRAKERVSAGVAALSPLNLLHEEVEAPVVLGAERQAILHQHQLEELRAAGISALRMRMRV